MKDKAKENIRILWRKAGCWLKCCLGAHSCIHESSRWSTPFTPGAWSVLIHLFKKCVSEECAKISFDFNIPFTGYGWVIFIFLVIWLTIFCEMLLLVSWQIFSQVFCVLNLEHFFICGVLSILHWKFHSEWLLWMKSTSSSIPFNISMLSTMATSLIKATFLTVEAINMYYLCKESCCI